MSKLSKQGLKWSSLTNYFSADFCHSLESVSINQHQSKTPPDGENTGEVLDEEEGGEEASGENAEGDQPREHLLPLPHLE